MLSGEPFSLAEVAPAWTPVPGRGAAAVAAALGRDEPQHPPLFYVAARGWLGLLGRARPAGAGGDAREAARADVAAIRLLGALGGLLLLPAGALAARELYRDRATGRAAAALLALSPFFVLYAREAREYAWWAAAMMASAGALLRALRTGRGWARHGLATAAALGLSLHGALLVAAEGMALVAFGRRRRAATGGLVLLGATALVAPWGLAVLRNRERVAAAMAWAAEIRVPLGTLLGRAALSLSRPFVDLGADFEHPLSGPAVAAALALLAATAVGLLRLPRDRPAGAPGPRRPEPAGLALLGAAFALPLALTLGPDLLLGGIRSLSTRYLTLSLLAEALVAAPLLAPLFGAPGRRGPGAAVLLVAGASSLAAVTGPPTWVKGVSRHLPEVAARIEPGALVVGNGEGHNPGNLLALARIAPPGTRLAATTRYETCELPARAGPVYLFSAIPPQVACLQARGCAVERLFADPFLSLDRVRCPR